MMFSKMDVYCPICRGPMDGMRGYGRSHCCGKECHDEWEWRRTLAILEEPYRPQPKKDDNATK